MAHKGLSAQLSDHSLYREYEAVVTGHMRGDSGVIDKPIGRHPVDRKRMAVTEKELESRCHALEAAGGIQGLFAYSVPP